MLKDSFCSTILIYVPFYLDQFYGHWPLGSLSPVEISWNEVSESLPFKIMLWIGMLLFMAKMLTVDGHCFGLYEERVSEYMAHITQF
jgi:hypothetical protein